MDELRRYLHSVLLEHGWVKYFISHYFSFKKINVSFARILHLNIHVQ